MNKCNVDQYCFLHSGKPDRKPARFRKTEITICDTGISRTGLAGFRQCCYASMLTQDLLLCLHPLKGSNAPLIYRPEAPSTDTHSPDV